MSSIFDLNKRLRDVSIVSRLSQDDLTAILTQVSNYLGDAEKCEALPEKLPEKWQDTQTLLSQLLTDMPLDVAVYSNKLIEKDTHEISTDLKKGLIDDLMPVLENVLLKVQASQLDSDFPSDATNKELAAYLDKKEEEQVARAMIEMKTSFFSPIPKDGQRSNIIDAPENKKHYPSPAMGTSPSK
jgi:hypothetical protein